MAAVVGEIQLFANEKDIGGSMALLDDILDWSKSELPEWQRDALRRLFLANSTLGQPDLDDLLKMLKVSHGLLDPQAPIAVPLSKSDIPSSGAPSDTAVLIALRDLTHVNKVAAGQTLSIGPTGITVIYGHNGSGKSGYSRVLKIACRARDQKEKVLPDAADPKSSSLVPQATFDIEIGGTTKAVTWTEGSPPPPELSTVAVFDVVLSELRARQVIRST